MRLLLDKLAQYLAEAGRERASFGIDARLNLSQVGPGSWIDFLHTWKELNATHLTVNTMGCGYETTSAHIDALKRFAGMVGLD
jgi:hypothetical protein